MVEIRASRIGKGVFAARSFEPRAQITRITGRMYDAGVVTRAGGKFADNCFRFGPETYLDPGDGAGRYLNHSCDPNAGIRKSSNQLFLFAVRRIRRHEEIAIDYSTILGDDDIWVMRCRCGSRKCRKRIKRFGSLPAELRERYADLGMVPRYILRAPYVAG